MKRFISESVIGLGLFFGYYGLRDPGFIDWGFHHLFYFSRSWVMLWGCLIILAVAALDSFPSIIQGMTDKINSNKKLLIGAVWVLIVGLGFSFFQFYQFYPLLGDAGHIVELIREGHGAYEFGFIKLYHYLLPVFISYFPGLPEYKIFYYTHPIWGIVYLVGLFFTARGLGRNEVERLFYFIGGAALGTIQYFFGYTESYAMAIAFQPWYFLFAFRFIHHKHSRDLILAIVVLLALMTIHFANMFLLFSLLAMVVFHYGRDPHLKHRKIVFVVLFILFLAVVGVGIYKWLIAGDLLGYLDKALLGFPVLQNGLDFVLQDLNYITISGIINLFGFFLLILAWLNRRIRQQVFQDGWLFFLMMGSTAVVSLHIFFPWFCFSAMDWDAASVNALILFLWAISFSLKFLTSRVYRVTAILLLLTLSNTIAWVWLNHSPEKSLQRYLDLMQINGVTCRRSGVGSYYAVKNHNIYLVSELTFNYLGLNDLAFKQAQQALEYCDGQSDDALLYNNLGHEYFIRQQNDQAAYYFRKALVAAPEFVLARLNLLQILLNTKQIDSITYHLAYLEENFRTSTDPRLKIYYPEYYMRIVEFYLTTQRYEKARQALLQLEEAINQSTRNSRRYQYIRMLRFKALILVYLKDYPGALQAVEEFSRYVPGDQLIGSIKKEIRQKMQTQSESR